MSSQRVGGVKEMVLFIGVGRNIRPIRGKCEYNLSCYFLESRKEYRENYADATKKISFEAYSHEFEDGAEKVQPYIKNKKKSQLNGNVCRLIVSKSALIKHISRGEVS